MAISNNGQQYQIANNNVAGAAQAAPQFINLTMLQGSGEVGRYLDDHTGVLLGIQPRAGFYQVKDRRTGVTISRPNSWTAVFSDGNMVSWPTYVDESTNTVQPWSRFDPSINLAEVVAKGIPVHLWKDDRKFFHLELAAADEEPVNLNPLPILNIPDAPTPTAPAAPAMPAQEPWLTGAVYGTAQ